MLVGFCMGGIWAIAGSLASRLVTGGSGGAATSVIFGGVAAASVLGIPIGAMLGEFFGWRTAFGVMTGFSAAVLALNLWALPALPVRRSVTARAFAEVAAQRQVATGLILTLLIVVGHFMAYTFVGPTLTLISGVGSEWLGILLFGYGIAGIAGNFLAGATAAKQIHTTLSVIVAGLGAAILGLAISSGAPALGSLFLILWGAAYGGVSVSLQTWMLRAAPQNAEIATALFVTFLTLALPQAPSSAAGSWI